MTKILPTAWTLIASLLLVPGLRADPVPSPSPSVVPSPKVSLAPVPSPDPTPERPALPKTLYLLEDTSVPIKGGLEGVSAGTEIKPLRDDGAKYLVSYNDHEFSVWKTQVTGNIDVVNTVRKRTAGVEAANEAVRRQGEAAYIQQQRAQVEFLRAHPLAVPTPTPTPKK